MSVSATVEAGRAVIAAAVFAAVLGVAGGAVAAPSYIALGDSITFGETDLNYVQSFGDRGYVAGVADALASRNGGVRPNVVNLAIDGETAASFLNNASPRTPPVQGRTNVPLQLENLNYNNSTALSQSQVFANTVAAQRAAGNTINTITVTLGFNELAALAPITPGAQQPTASQVAATLSAYQGNYTTVLNQVRGLAPEADLYLLGYYNPFPADPTSPAAPIFNTYGAQLNSTIQGLAAQYGAFYVNNFTPFLGKEALYTYQDDQPAGSSVSGQYGGVLPIGNVHPNQLGYNQIRDDVLAATTQVPEPATWAVLITGLGAMGAVLRRRRSASTA